MFCQVAFQIIEFMFNRSIHYGEVFILTLSRIIISLRAIDLSGKR